MKPLALLLISISTCVSACNQQETEPVPQVPAASTSSSAPRPSADQPGEKKVCIRVYDAKEKQEVEKCRTSKVYQKHQGVPIPPR